MTQPAERAAHSHSSLRLRLLACSQGALGVCGTLTHTRACGQDPLGVWAGTLIFEPLEQKDSWKISSVNKQILGLARCVWKEHSEPGMGFSGGGRPLHPDQIWDPVGGPLTSAGV